MNRTQGLYLGIGAAAGFFGGLVGLGGGIVMVPMLTGMAGFSQRRAHGTSLAALVFTGMAGAATYAFSGAVDFLAAGALAATAVLSAGAGARSAHRLPADKLKRYFGIFQLGVAALLIAKPWLIHGSVPGVWSKIFWLLAAGAATGFLSGMMGVGGGSIMVPAMVLLAGMGQHVAQGSSLLAMVPAGIAGAAAHNRLGNVAGEALWWLLPGIAAGAFAGGMAAAAIDADWLRALFACVLIYMGGRYATSSAKN
ncbi:MAG: sulfite exporter TauE/SafE family protein [Nitrospinae bacterium]|nr:sulfite exporter TauE/SafE family protein [Nitrospinota bacterium]